MTIQYILKNLKDGQAAKRPSMRGYIKMVGDGTKQFDGPAKYSITFVKNLGENNPENYNSYTFTRDADGHMSVALGDLEGNHATPLTLDPQLLQHFAADDWEIGSFEDYESVRIGATGQW